MAYRIELTAANRVAPLPDFLSDQRFPSFLSAIVAVRTSACQLREALAEPVIVSIFDRQERLATQMRLFDQEAA